MAEVFAPFPIQRTMCNLTFYMREGRNFVRKKSSLTRRKVLYSPRFENTRFNASVMGQASKIGSYLYNSLPVYWRQSWMYRSFTGEAYTLLKKGKEIWEVRQFLWDRYIREVVGKQTKTQPSPLESIPAKRAYNKQDTNYWEAKTRKRIQRKARKEQRQKYSELLAEASGIASELYWKLPPQSRKRSDYQALTGWAMKWLKDQEENEVTNTALAIPASPVESSNTGKQQKNTCNIGSILHRRGMFYFIPPCKRSSPVTVASISPPRLILLE